MEAKRKTDEEMKNEFIQKFFCDSKDCSEHFAFTISQFDLKNKNERKRAFKGRCNACHDSIALTEVQFFMYEIFFGKAKLKVISNNYNDLFE